jgi:hypothetical protein
MVLHFLWLAKANGALSLEHSAVCIAWLAMFSVWFKRFVDGRYDVMRALIKRFAGRAPILKYRGKIRPTV